jgi:hypothetical protein
VLRAYGGRIFRERSTLAEIAGAMQYDAEAD